MRRLIMGPSQLLSTPYTALGTHRGGSITSRFGKVTEIERLDHVNLACMCMLRRFSRVQLFATPWTVARQAPLSMEFSRRDTEVGCHFLLQGIIPTRRLNPSLLGPPHWQAGSSPPAPPRRPESALSYWSIAAISWGLLPPPNFHHILKWCIKKFPLNCFFRSQVFLRVSR